MENINLEHLNAPEMGKTGNAYRINGVAGMAQSV
jgi:hypothetical protein